MTGGIRILSIDGSRTADVSSDNSLQTVLYDGYGNPLAVTDASTLNPATQRGILNAGRDYKIARLQRSSPDGTLRAGNSQCIFYDSIEGTQVDSNKWFGVQTGFAGATQAAGTGTLYNPGSSTTASNGDGYLTNRYFPFIGRGALVFRTRTRHGAHFNNNLIEAGFGSPASAIGATVVNGAHWRKRDTDGAYLPVVTVNSVELTGTTISQATFTAAIASTDYFYQEVFLEESRATFRITTQAGVVVNEQSLDFGTTIGTFTATHLQIFHRNYNNATGPGTAVQSWVAQTSVWLVDAVGPDYATVQTQLNYGSLTNPTQPYTQLSNYSNSAAPSSATLSNSAAGYVNLGGQWQFAMVSTAETDFALFAIQIPSPYAFVCTGVRISAVNTGAQNSGATATIIQWGLGFNSNAVALNTGAPYPYMRKAIGTHTLLVSAAIGQTLGPDIVWQGRETIQPGRYFAIICKVYLGAATASQIIRGTCDVNGYFE